MSGRDEDPSWPSSVCRDPPGIPRMTSRTPRLTTLIIIMPRVAVEVYFSHLVSVCPGSPGGGGGHGHDRG